MHMQGNAGIAFDETFDHPGKRITRLRVRGGNIKGAFIRPGMFPGDGFNGVDFGEHFPCDAYDFLSCRGDLSQVLTAAGKYLNT